MEWLVPNKLMVAAIAPFEELEQYAMAAIEAKVPLGDEDNVSIKREYDMKVPPLFEKWMVDTIDEMFWLHKDVGGIFGNTKDKMRIIKMWANEMLKGDQHQPHLHQYALYSFSCYIRTTNDDAPFYFIWNETGNPVHIDANSQGHALIFPSTLIHTVYPKRTDEVRISVSGNVVIDVDKT